MLTALFQPAENSLACQNWAGTGRPRWYPLLMLVWTIWIFLTPLYDPTWSHWLVPTMCSFAAFLALYYVAYYCDRRYVFACSFAIASLAFLVTPCNPGAQGYLIYACAFLPSSNRPRHAVRYMVLLLALYALEWLYLGYITVYLISAILVAFAVGMMNIAYMRRRKAEAEVRLSHEEVRRLAATAERERIGRDLHDLLGHTLSLITLKSELANKLFDRDPASAKREMADVERVARDALAQVRRAVTGIRAAGFAAELASAKLLLESNNVRLDYVVGDVSLPVDIETVLAMTVREAVTNIQRHANASAARIVLESASGRITLRVEDNGQGGAIVPGNGLSGMRERLSSVGAQLGIESQRGQGTTLTVRVPLPQTPLFSFPPRDAAADEARA